MAIVNRGEPAVRAIHAIRELEHTDPRGRVAIALHTDAERAAMFVREADEAVRIGPAAGEPPAETSPYLDLDELARALTEAGADAAWVGWGFVAEHAGFADRCEEIGVTFVGPSGEVMRRLGDKIGAKRLAEQAGVPVAPWSGGPVASADEARRHADHIGYPLVVKAAAGGGGRGIRVVHEPDELETSFERARDEARRAFGDATVFMERLVCRAHHVEVQIVADGRGGVWTPGVRDCSTQRRNQKVLEESASPALPESREAELREAAAELARLAEYRGAGTVEFLYQPAEDLVAFLEVNTRLQVEHTVTEEVTGLDLVKLQLHVAEGGRLEGDPPPAHGHAIEVRLNAEDVERAFTPAPGTIAHLALPAGPGIRIDTGVAEGDVIPPEYDSMVAKVIAWGADRRSALGRLGRALTQTTVLVRGGTTNRAFLLDLVEHPDIVDGPVDTGWLDRLAADGYAFRTRSDVALIEAAIEAFEEEAEHARNRFYAAAARGRPQASTEVGRTIDLREGGVAYRMGVARTGPSRYLVTAAGRRIVVDVERLRAFERRLSVGDQRHRIASIAHEAERLIEVDGIPHRISQDDAGLIRTPGPGLLVALTVEEGDDVEAGSTVAVLESMKMETALAAPVSGRVREVLVSANVQLDAGTPVVRLEPEPDDRARTRARPADFGALATASARHPDDPRDRERAALDAMRRLVLGYDLSSRVAEELVEELEYATPAHGGDEPATFDAEVTVLRIFADLASLSRNRRIGDEEDRAEARAAREYLHAFLRSLDVDAEGLPDSFRAKLERALAHYGFSDLERTPALEEALYRVHLAQQRAAAHVPAILALLERRMRARQPPDEERGEALREVLDHLIRATQVRHPVVGDLARRARHRCFEEPRLEAERAAVYREVRRHLAALVEQPDAPDRDERMAAMVAAPQPLLGMLEDPLVAVGGLHPMLEVLTRRYYRTREIREVRSVSPPQGGWEPAGAAQRGHHDAVVADVADQRGHGRVVAVATSREELDDAIVTADALTRDLLDDAGAGAVADIYVAWFDPPSEPDALAAAVQRALDGLPSGTWLRRVTFSVTTAAAGNVGTAEDAAARPASAGLPTSRPSRAARPEVQHLTFRRDEAGHFSERRHLRGIHPLIAGRLDLWRFEHFALSRLPSADGVFLFRGVAHENPADERLFALAEIRDFTPVLDADGRVTALPELERVFAECIADLRQARATYPLERRPEWNRVLLHVWPQVDLPLDEVDPVVRALAPMTEDLGLEQVQVHARLGQPDGSFREAVVRMYRPPGQGLTLRVTDPSTQPLQPLDEMTQKVQRARRRGTIYPYELVPLLLQRPDEDPAGASPGRFTEYDLGDDGTLTPVDRPYGQNRASVVVGTVSTPSDRYPEGMHRVALIGDPTKGLGSLAEAECRRINAALDLAEEHGLPVEWFAVSSGARIAMDSGTENMDWIGRVLRRIIEFTQQGGEINVVVTGINVGAQPYWNAEATMLMHTKGILVMTPASAMVLTGKQALDYSGGVSAEDNFGIGGYDRVMGPNGQAQYWAPDVNGALRVLFAHYDHGYVAPGERFPRRAHTVDPAERDVREAAHDAEGLEFTRIGEIFDEGTNSGRKRPFDIRALMRAVADRDHRPLERWADMADADTAVVFDAHLGGYPCTLLGFESRPVPRRGFLPADGPDQWTAGTLFPHSSRKTARAINAASGSRPLVVLANLSGFDGSPESLRELQLEFGAEIGRAVVNFSGPIVFCVVSRYHGGAFVVFSRTLNDGIEVAAVEGAHASVIGGQPAAAVVFAGEVKKRTEADPRVQELAAQIEGADEGEAARLRARLDEVRGTVRAEKIGEMAAEFDRVHDVERARDVGSIDTIIPPERLRPYLVDAVERGMTRALTDP
ncbi:carboxyl transferase domain-containing protein [Egibacter rhizosphaerae]|uniref:ATP-binding protein n=1 Tax=Egibacter rhizosphaerae TaxID=1670831 RepID=UPI0023EA670B|nr:carboxyl transferase domain-containing protein [Egibacter rhizosphaerae]